MPKIFVSIVIAFVACAFVIFQTGYPQISEEYLDDEFQTPCSDCHVCDKPTIENPCLQHCPRHGWEMTTVHTTAESPEMFVINEIENQYYPVVFAHNAHAHMSEMGTGCMECHHYTPPGEIPPCIECHSTEGVNPGNLRQPGLKGAYHRQCIACHQEWSHDTACEVCHARKRPEEIGTPITYTDQEIKDAHRPHIHLPDKKIYKTDLDEGPYVTFFHDQHAEIYGLTCDDCHVGQDCATCHTPPEMRLVGEKTFEEHHDPCISCHEEDACEKCHQIKEAARFTHAKTGWELGRYHEEVACNACHPRGRRIARLDRACTSCHRQWHPETFDHKKVTGIKLGEVHASFDCESCHLEKKYDERPSCATCHEGDLPFSLLERH